MGDDNFLCKLFKLERPNTWTTSGIGNAGIQNYDGKFYLEFLNNAQKNKPYLLEISEGNGFEHEEDRIITFCSDDNKTDYALSFEKVIFPINPDPIGRFVRQVLERIGQHSGMSQIDRRSQPLLPRNLAAPGGDSRRLPGHLNKLRRQEIRLLPGAGVRRPPRPFKKYLRDPRSQAYPIQERSPIGLPTNDGKNAYTWPDPKKNG